MIFQIPLVSGARIAESCGHWSVGWEDEEFGPQRGAFALESTLHAIDRLPVTVALVTGLDLSPDLCALAASIHEIHKIRAMSSDEAFPLLVALRSSEQPEAIRAIAAREMLRRNGLRDQPAVCDASRTDS